MQYPWFNEIMSSSKSAKIHNGINLPTKQRRIMSSADCLVLAQLVERSDVQMSLPITDEN